MFTYLRQSTDLFREFEVGVLRSERRVLPVGFIDEEDAGGHHEADEDDADDGQHDGDLSLLSHLLRRLPGHVFVARPGVCKGKKERTARASSRVSLTLTLPFLPRCYSENDRPKCQI